MLSHLYRLTDAFRRTHGFCPNLLYLNRRHYQWLRASLAGMKGEDEVRRFLGMDVLIVSEIEHPDVAYRDVGRSRPSLASAAFVLPAHQRRGAVQGCAGCALAWTARVFL